MHSSVRGSCAGTRSSAKISVEEKFPGCAVRKYRVILFAFGVRSYEKTYIPHKWDNSPVN